MKQLLPLSFFLLALAGCEQPTTVGPYEHDHFSLGIISYYSETRVFDLMVRDNLTNPGHPREVLAITTKVSRGDGMHGIGLACPELGRPFSLKVVLKDSRTSDVVATSKWDLECAQKYTLILDEGGRMSVYSGTQTQPPFQSPLNEAATP